jgi:hypothetical protein
MAKWYSAVVPTRSCIVFVPAENGNGNFTHYANVESSFAAAWQALQEHEAIHKRKVPDDAILHVVIDGKDSHLHDFKEHNAKQPNFRHRVGRVREWAESKKCLI